MKISFSQPFGSRLLFVDTPDRHQVSQSPRKEVRNRVSFQPPDSGGCWQKWNMLLIYTYIWAILLGCPGWTPLHCDPGWSLFSSPESLHLYKNELKNPRTTRVAQMQTTPPTSSAFHVGRNRKTPGPTVFRRTVERGNGNEARHFFDRVCRASSSSLIKGTWSG